MNKYTIAIITASAFFALPAMAQTADPSNPAGAPLAPNLGADTQPAQGRPLEDASGAAAITRTDRPAGTPGETAIDEDIDATVPSTAGSSVTEPAATNITPRPTGQTSRARPFPFRPRKAYV